ncbi:MAG: type I DNA topoisomerase [Deltaproteobacteria bacterium]|nr:type I DNA topoisomerase [Deltaproteobacteria bacterium]
MAKNLVIVESPAKAKTIGKYLGRDYQVKASVGHVMDLPKSKLGVDVKKGFAAEYQVIQGKAKIIEELRKAAKDKERIFLASDPDREGEAIAWHIAEKLVKKGQKVHRILLNEITKKAVLAAVENPTDLNRDRYNAQVARRILDRLVGYQLSPLLWKKVRRGLSAGRVQSVAVRIITEREREVLAFVPEEYWSIIALLEGKIPPQFEARLARIGDKRVDNKTFRISNDAEAKEILAHLEGATWTVAKVEKRERRRNPAPPFITSRLQQEASRKLGYAPSRTMGIAQKLYMGVEVGDDGAVGLITYMRTDSPRISPDMMTAARDFIGKTFGDKYVPEKPNIYRSGKSAQEAHEAIRPTSLDYPPDRVAPYLSREELNLYTLIWNRFMASQMASALFEQTSADITANNCMFRATGQVLRFDGFLRVYMEGRDDKAADDEDEDEKQLPPLNENDILDLRKLTPNQHFTQPPPRFTQATLIKEMEEKGIGRPSTYASIMGTIINKEYVSEDEQRRLRPTSLGMMITDLLVGSFPDILNTEFTAGMEEVLDKIEDGQEDWKKALERFYTPFSADLERADKEMRDVKGAAEPTDIACPKCTDGKMQIRWGRNGEFLACANYPECKSTSNFTRDEEGQVVLQKEELEGADEACEKCGKPMQVRFSRYGKFLGCSGYPECKNIKKTGKAAPVSLGVQCPECNKGDIQQKRSNKRGKIFYSCSAYPKCTFALWDRPIAEPCPQCQAPFIVEKTSKKAGTTRRCFREECDYQAAVEMEPLAEAV